MNVIQRTITPMIAAEFLKGNTKNRSLSGSTVARYARDMAAGLWGPSPDAIVIGKDGAVYNGQHRLHALIKAEVSLPFFVVDEAGEDFLWNTDVGKKRTARDVANLTNAVGRAVRSLDLAVSSLMCDLRSPTPHEAVDNLAKYEKSVSFVTSRCRTNKRGVVQGPVLAPIARAHHLGHDAERLAHFLSVLMTGEAEGRSDRMAVKLRDLATDGHNTGRIGKLPRGDLYARTENALANYLVREDPKMLYPAGEELFPISEKETGSLDAGSHSARMRAKLAALLNEAAN